MNYPLAPNGIFWTLQGEGALQGTPMAFVRLAGCSVRCPECDTDYRIERRVSVEDIVRETRLLVPEAFRYPTVWITGGEPTDHDLTPLIRLFQDVGFAVALATTGMKPAPAVGWLSVSPHQFPFKQRYGSELKLVPGLNGLTWDTIKQIDRERREWSFYNRFVQPLADDKDSLRECIAFVQSHEGWRLTTQAHKAWGLP